MKEVNCNINNKNKITDGISILVIVEYKGKRYSYRQFSSGIEIKESRVGVIGIISKYLSKLGDGISRSLITDINNR